MDSGTIGEVLILGYGCKVLIVLFILMHQHISLSISQKHHLELTIWASPI